MRAKQPRGRGVHLPHQPGDVVQLLVHRGKLLVRPLVHRVQGLHARAQLQHAAVHLGVSACRSSREGNMSRVVRPLSYTQCESAARGKCQLYTSRRGGLPLLRSVLGRRGASFTEASHASAASPSAAPPPARGGGGGGIRCHTATSAGAIAWASLRSPPGKCEKRCHRLRKAPGSYLARRALQASFGILSAHTPAKKALTTTARWRGLRLSLNCTTLQKRSPLKGAVARVAICTTLQKRSPLKGAVARG